MCVCVCACVCVCVCTRNVLETLETDPGASRCLLAAAAAAAAAIIVVAVAGLVLFVNNKLKT